jgi:hypothetical protein
MDEAAEDHWAGFLGDRKAQLWEANLLGGFNVNCDWYIQRNHFGLRLSAEPEDDYRNGHKGFV